MEVTNIIVPDIHKSVILGLKIKISNVEYILGRLSFNIKENQLYYLLDWSDERPDRQIYLNTGECTSGIDKVSFHKDSTHIKIKIFNENGSKEIKCGRVETPFLPTQDGIKILYIESFIFSNEPEKMLSKSYNQKRPVDQEKVIANNNMGDNFSLVLLLAPSLCSIENILFVPIFDVKNQYINLDRYKRDGYTIGSVKAFDGFDLIIFPMPFVGEIDPKGQVIPSLPIRLINYHAPEDSLFSIACKYFLHCKSSDI